MFDLTLMEFDITKLGTWLPILGICDYPIEPQVGDIISVPERGKSFPALGEWKAETILRSVRVVSRELPTPGMGKGLTLYVEEV